MVTVIQSRDGKFRDAFLKDSRNLAMCLVSVIEDASLEVEVEKSPLLWGQNTRTLFASDDPEAPSEVSLQFFLVMPKVSARSGSDIQNLRSFWEEWIEANSQAADESPAATPDVLTEQVEAVAEEPEAAPEQVVAEQVAAEPSPKTVVEVSKDVVDNSDVVWTIDTVRVDNDVFELRQKTLPKKKSIRIRVYETLETIRAKRGTMSVKEFSKVLRDNKSTYGNFRAENTYLNQERAEKWAKNLGISVRELLGYPQFDNAVGQTSLPAEEPEVVVSGEVAVQSDEGQDMLDVLNCINRNEIVTERIQELFEMYLEGRSINFKDEVRMAAELRMRAVADSVASLYSHPVWKQIGSMTLADFIAMFDQK